MDHPPPYAIVLDDHPLVGRGMAQYLGTVLPALEVAVATQWRDVPLLSAQRGCPRLLVADVWLAEGPCLDALVAWRRGCVDTPWLAVSGDDDPSVIERVRAAGALGFVPKKAAPETFGAALRAVLAGRPWFEPAPGADARGSVPHQWTIAPRELGLTPRQGEILALVLRGLPNKRIASQLDISESTVKEHVTGILERLGVRSRVEAITLLRGRRLELS
ncbi:response regulator transcription factor [Hydrogenophaga electricum]|uniref:DNA-binding response regulator n=1 Tax=Hydrogenophaga electricum TaxID=1230953 RepID=A0ABQ6C359_9BURK|nr:response regulator transcription factor [Hydrogenophaga electricum]GLS14179.1 DNA-binding response regulator [Hydrogenophaga electricum]